MTKSNLMTKLKILMFDGLAKSPSTPPMDGWPKTSRFITDCFCKKKQNHIFGFSSEQKARMIFCVIIMFAVIIPAFFSLGDFTGYPNIAMAYAGPAGDGSPCVATAGADTAAFYRQGVDAYNRQEFKNASLCFEAAIANGLLSGDSFYNLGNSYFRQQKTGMAILNYKRAELYAPLDADLRHNLEYAVSMVRDSQADGANLTEMFTLPFLTQKQIFFVFVLASLLFWLLLAASRRALLRWVVMVFMLVAGVSLGIRSMVIRGVVVNTGDTIIRSAPDSSGGRLFVVHEGLMVKVTGRSNGWIKVSFAGGKRGWVEDGYISSIRDWTFARLG